MGISRGLVLVAVQAPRQGVSCVRAVGFADLLVGRVSLADYLVSVRVASEVGETYSGEADPPFVSFGTRRFVSGLAVILGGLVQER